MPSPLPPGEGQGEGGKNTDNNNLNNSPTPTKTLSEEPFDAGYSKPRDNALLEILRILSNIWRHPANTNCKARSVVRFMAWQLRKRVLRHRMDIDYHGARLICYPDSHSTSAAVYFNGLPDYPEMRFMQDYLRKGDGFLDLGANMGLYSILARRCVGDTGSVDAFEPIQSTADRLAEQIALNDFDNVFIHQLVACDRNDVVTFGLADSDSLMHLQRDNETSSAQAWQLQGVRLDDWVGDRRFAMAKMDIEGSEPVVLAGAPGMLAEANPPVWLTEIAGYSKLYGVPTHEFIAEAGAKGFEPAIYDPETRELNVVPRPWELPIKNVFLISMDHRDEIDARLNARYV